MQLLVTVTVTVTVSSQEEPAALPRPAPRSFRAAPRNGGGGQARPRSAASALPPPGAPPRVRQPAGLTARLPSRPVFSRPEEQSLKSQKPGDLLLIGGCWNQHFTGTGHESGGAPAPRQGHHGVGPGPGAGLSLKPSGPGSPAGDSVPQGPRRLHRGRDSEQPPSRVAQPDPWATAAAATRHVGLRRALFGCGEGFSP